MFQNHGQCKKKNLERQQEAKSILFHIKELDPRLPQILTHFSDSEHTDCQHLCTCTKVVQTKKPARRKKGESIIHQVQLHSLVSICSSWFVTPKTYILHSGVISQTLTPCCSLMQFFRLNIETRPSKLCKARTKQTSKGHQKVFQVNIQYSTMIVITWLKALLLSEKSNWIMKGECILKAQKRLKWLDIFKGWKV